MMDHHHRVLTSIAAGWVLAFAADAAADILNVPGDHVTIQAAVDAAQSGDEVVIAPGEYVQSIDLLGKAITVRSADPENLDVVARTVINGGGAAHVVRCVSGEGPDTVLHGLTITGGDADGFGEDRLGGGMLNRNSSPTIVGCTFLKNSAGEGGGMMNVSANPKLIKCTFSANVATSGRGGGMANRGSSPIVDDCVFWGNEGGGMYNGEKSRPSIEDAVFASNTAEHGGGMYNDDGSGATLLNCTVTRNRAESGGGLFNDDGTSTVINTAFTFNTATVGGGLYNAGGNPVLVNCVLTANTARHGGGLHNASGDPRVTNCIIWHNDGGEIHVAGGKPEVTSSNVRGGFAGRGNIDADPLLTDPVCGLCHRASGSPAYGGIDWAALAAQDGSHGAPPAAHTPITSPAAPAQDR